MVDLLHHPINFEEWIFIVILVGTVGGLAIGAIAVVTDYSRGRARDEMDASLKMEMIERGLSAEEITQVLTATSTSDDPPPWAAAASQAAANHCREQRRAMREAARAAKGGHA